MKRILAILCAMACLFALAVPALAAPDTITITAQAPSDWEELFIHAWGGPDDAGTNWPGLAMTKGADGRFTIELDAGFTGILVHNNNGRQSNDMVITGTENVWIVYDGGDKTGGTATPTDPGVQDLGTSDTPAAPVLPEGDVVTVHCYVVPENVSPKLWAWQRDGETDTNAFANWPGESLKKDGKWWNIEMPAACNYIIINDGGSHQTGDTQVEAGKEMWVVVQYDWKISVFYAEPKLEDVIVEKPPIENDPKFSRPTLGPTEAATEPTAVEETDGLTKKTQAIIVIVTAVMVIVAVAFVLSIPKKMK